MEKQAQKNPVVVQEPAELYAAKCIALAADGYRLLMVRGEQKGFTTEAEFKVFGKVLGGGAVDIKIPALSAEYAGKAAGKTITEEEVFTALLPKIRSIAAAHNEKIGIPVKKDAPGGRGKSSVDFA